MRALAITALLALVLAGCLPIPLTNEQIIAETKKCEAAGLRAVALFSGFDSRTRRIECRPNEGDVRP